MAAGCIVVIHENRGLSPYLEDVARRLAVEGYVALGDLARFDDIGSPRTMTHYPRGWAMAGRATEMLVRTK